MLGDINRMKEKLHREIEIKGLDHKQVLEISQELDELIVEYVNQKIISERENE